MEADIFSSLEKVIFIDPGNRGLENLWTPGCLSILSDKILKCDKSKKSYVLTGFCCMFGRCETDGPLGSSVLCSTLRSLGFNTELLCDKYAEPVVKAASHGNPVTVVEDPNEIADPSFIISVERPGRSLKTDDFRTMKARDITNVTAPLDLLFPKVGDPPKPYLTVSVGDGGNEIGTGNIYEKVKQFVSQGEEICTSIACDILVMAGVSNWGALAIAAALVVASQCEEAKETFVNECNKQEEILSSMISAGSYDGCTGKSELSIDGMKFENEHLNVTNQLVKIVETSINKK
ncbi:DUF4392 domain-containing protein [Histomonas meleagridis]|uniref:DUF4392 domain-containing protein n=1 Tax=Histomonas meleagridis TaxID=135588 RepID=UPI003559BBAB|nr:DUF4392 domain-containing protein [Histomonas meleagridis]KAH0804402.1 DUF4392 domain-containing protein [Histomonas meleagridis]